MDSDASPSAEADPAALADVEASDQLPRASDPGDARATAPRDAAAASSGSYDAAALVRPLGDWEVSRDHLVFVDVAGYDTAKRGVLHVLEPPSAAKKHGGVLLTAVGNTAQLLTLAPLDAPAPPSAGDTDVSPTVQSRRFIFGTSGGGVGSLAVHPSGSFFAVAEKGVKPCIVVYSYPAPVRAARVLRNGTERAYASVCFSGLDARGEGGDKLASVGAAPDFLLTVWNWRQEATILRCKAFGQEVFRVQFAPADSGFLATSGVGHVRMWKMAATFTGLKLQGDIGKFGKSELSDVDAFCVLPDKKVLSGTERGALLLWEGHFIKCEVFTSRRHLPHAGPVRVVDLDKERGHVVTAGADGFVRFWSLESIDAADVPPDDSVALIPMKRQVLVAPQMDIRAVVALGDAAALDGRQRYLVQDAAGGVHLLTLLDGETHAVDLDFLANDTGRATGVACSPYEHLAATCGADGSVRAWDYVSQRCLLAAAPIAASTGAVTASAPSSTKNAAAGAGKSGRVAAASAICWVPDAAALLPVAQAGGGAPADAKGQVHSRQVVVGYDDGLVRVFLVDVPRRSIVRTNVFKPHSARVTCVAFSAAPSGGHAQLATGSADGTVFFLRVVPNARSSKFAKYPPEYVPLGFQRAPDAVRDVCWRPDGAAVLATLVCGRVIEYLMPAEGLSAPGVDADGGERETFELTLASREWAAPIERHRFMSSRELAALESANPVGNPAVDDAARLEFHAQTSAATPNAYAALYASGAVSGSHDTIWLSCGVPTPSVQGQQHKQQKQEASRSGALLVVQLDKPVPLLECAMGEAHLEDGTPTAAALGDARVVSLARSSSSRFLLCGLSNGQFQLRSASHPVAFLTGEFHDAAGDGRAGLRLALSFDDSFVVAAGADGNLSVSRLHADKLLEAARRLADAHASVRAQAAIVADQARDKQAAANQKALTDAKSAEAEGEGAGVATGGGSELSASPAFQAAKAFAAFIESRLAGSADAPSVAKDSEAFGGVVRLATDPSSTMGLPAVDSSSNVALPTAAGESAGLPPSVIEAPEVENPGEAYTIEDAKRKSEADARARAAMSKQDQTRAVLAHMRQQLRQLQERDAALPPESRVDADEWEVDLDYGELLAARGDAACEEVRRELAFAVEKEELLLLKLREFFVGPLAVELVTVRAFRGAASVQTFRTLKMPPALQKRLAEIHAAAPGGGASREPGAGPRGSVAGAVKRLSSAVDIDASALGTHTPPPPERKKASVLRKPSVLHIMTDSALALDGDFPLKDEERKLLARSMATAAGLSASNGAGGGAASGPAACAPPGAPVALSAPLEPPAAASASSGASVHGFEARKRLRAERKARLARWEAARPGEDADDPRDVVAIAFARRNMGDYKLKSAADYVVPEAQRVDAARKARQLALLEERLYAARLRFNARVLELRELKARLVGSLARDAARLERLYAWLGLGAPAVEASLLRVDLGEWPEQRERVTDADLQLFQRERRVLPHSAASAADASVVGARSGGGGSERGRGEAADRVTLRHLHVPAHRSDSVHATCAGVELADGGATALKRGADADDAAVREYLARAEVSALERRRWTEVAAFDAAVALLRRDKMRLDVALKAGELRLSTLARELALLEQFESKENLLSARLARSQADKAQIEGELAAAQEQAAARRREQEDWAAQERAVHAELLALVNGAAAGGGPHPSLAALQKVFRRRIKRAKKRKDGKGGDVTEGGAGKDREGGDREEDPEEEEEEEEEELEEEEDEDEEDDEDDDEEEDACPPGCDLALYEKVLALRERRADVDEAAGELARALEELRKGLERLATKQRQADKELAATEQEAQAFQSEKQQRFNELDVALALSLRQVRCLERVEPQAQGGGGGGGGGWRAPETAGSCLVFSTRALAALAARVEGLQRENRSLRQQFRDLHRQQAALARDKHAQQAAIAQAARRGDQLQLLKFGRVVDMDVLDRASDTSALRELQDRVRAQEAAVEREAAAGRQDELALQRELLRATEDNTALLARVAELSARQLALERELDESGAATAQGLQDDAAAQLQLEQEARERGKLVRLVKLQARELEALAQEVGLLRGKDGKVYAPRV